MSSEEPLESVSKGATKALLEYTESKIKTWITKFRNRELAFVQDPETINLAKEQRKTSEWNLFKEYIDDPDLRILFQMGLTLRRLEKQNKQLESLRQKIKNKYDLKGLHIAQFIQNGFFGKYIGNILERASTPQELKFEIESLLENIEKTVVFIKQDDDEEKRTELIVTKILANSPKTFIVCSTKSAMGKCEEIKKRVMRRIADYDVELYKTDIKKIYFLNKSEEAD